MVSLFQAVVLSIVQGITEWFPVSSSGHLALLQQLFGFQNLAYDVFLHFASILAVIVIFRKDIINLIKFDKKWKFVYFGLLILAVIPAFIVGVLLKKYIIGSFHNPLFLGIFFIFSGIVIYSTKYAKEKKSEVGIIESLFIGLMQVFALFPGVSRSGMTISAGLFAGLKKQEVIKFSFLLAIPIIFGASLAEATQIFNSDTSCLILSVSLIITFLVSLITIKLLLKIISGEKFYLFGVYNFILGLIVLIFSIILKI